MRLIFLPRNFLAYTKPDHYLYRSPWHCVEHAREAWISQGSVYRPCRRSSKFNSDEPLYSPRSAAEMHRIVSPKSPAAGIHPAILITESPRRRSILPTQYAVPWEFPDDFAVDPADERVIWLHGLRHWPLRLRRTHRCLPQ